MTDCKDAPLTGSVILFHKRDVQLTARNCADEGKNLFTAAVFTPKRAGLNIIFADAGGLSL